jgi:DNA-binding MarR family transcriptional regulator
MTGTQQADADEAELAGRLRLATGRLHRRVRLASSDLPPLQLSTLATLSRHGPLRPGDLAQREAVSAPVMTRVLAALDEARLIRRTPDPDDARCVNIALSAAGEGHLARMRAEGIAYLDARIARLDQAQRRALAAALPALEALVEDEG